MSTPPFTPLQGSCSTVGMDRINEDNDQEFPIEENADEMSEEELRSEDLNGEGTEEGAVEEASGAFQPKKRLKKSIIWENMKIIKKNGVERLQCLICKKDYAKSGSGSTTQHKRHIIKCLREQQAKGGDNAKVRQQILHFTEAQSEGITSIANFSYNHEKVRQLASHMVLVHEYPFSMMDHVVFNKFMKAVTPFYKKITRQQVREDCNSTYEQEKKKLFSMLKGVSRVSITTDLWKSGQKLQYMVVTGHFVDVDWVLQKRVLNFCNVPPPHTGVIIADALSRCFIDWGIENKISSITVDNASYNDVCINRLKTDFALRKKLSIGGRLFHVRCCAHILNLLVQDGLKKLGNVTDIVRDGVKYLNNSESRLIQFSKITKQLQLPSRKLILDCQTRWNSTYLMLTSALQFKSVFSRYGDIDPRFVYVPSDSDWCKVEEVCKFLGIFHEITNMISGSDYPTSNIFLMELYRVKELLNEKMADVSVSIKEMAVDMTTKFDKYWGKSNVLLSIAAILDPRYKMALIDHVFPIIYGETRAVSKVVEIKALIYDLYNEYVQEYISSHAENATRQQLNPQKKDLMASRNVFKKHGVNVVTGKEKFLMRVTETEKTPPEKLELDVYLEENRYKCEDISANLDVLAWWKLERLKFPILSKMASDILSIPVTTVASESTFSAGGRIVDDRRSSMTVDTVQMLLCGNDWIRNLYGVKTRPRESLDAAESSSYQEVELPNQD